MSSFVISGDAPVSMLPGEGCGTNLSYQLIGRESGVAVVANCSFLAEMDGEMECVTGEVSIAGAISGYPRLNISYVWMDSLCRIQDVLDGWMKIRRGHGNPI
jgi:hypothetical protein